MRTLVIETATAACSVALIEDGRMLAASHEVVGRGHAERLVPMIGDLPDQGRAPRILVDCGPGSFTGIRVGIAAARGLAIGWSAQVFGYSSLPLIAAAAFAEQTDIPALAVILEGGHGEVFMQGFTSSPFLPEDAFRSITPPEALAALGGRPAFGNGVRHLAALGGGELHETLPRAADALLLGDAFTALPPRPIYGRAPDAKTLAERGLA